MTNSRAPTACRTSLTRRRSGAQARRKRWPNWWRSWLRMTRASSQARFSGLTAEDEAPPRTPRTRIEDRGSRIEDSGAVQGDPRSSILDPRSSILVLGVLGVLAVDSLQLFNPRHDQHHSDRK